MKDTPYTRLRLAKEAAEAKPTAETLTQLAEALRHTRYKTCTIRPSNWYLSMCLELFDKLDDSQTEFTSTFTGDQRPITVSRISPTLTVAQPLDNLKSQA